MATEGVHPPPGAIRVLLAMAGASLASLVSAVADSTFARTAAGGVVGKRFELLVADAGVIAPLGLVTGLGAGVATALLAPDLLARGSLAGGAPQERRGRAAGILVAGPGGLVIVVALAQIARWLLAADAPPPLTGAALAIAAALASLTLGAGVAVAGRVATESEWRWLPSPSRALAISAAATVALLVVGVALGTPNGDGGPLGILGVLAREELDLRGVSLALAIFGAALLAPLLVRGVRMAPALMIVGAPMILTIAADRILTRAPSLALAIERGAPLGARALGALRRLGDRDHDGASARFGGGDCNDRDPRMFSGADDVPGNDIDEDCSGADDVPAPGPPAPSGHSSNGEAAGVRLPAPLGVVLVTIDTLRADLGFAGNPRPVSPRIDALARRSVVFDRAYSLASYTGKSLGPMLLGKYPSETRRTFDHFDRFGTDETFVQERLRRAGIRTLTAQGHWYFRPETGLGRGFDDADHSAAPRVPQAEGDTTVNGDQLTDAAIRLLSKPDNVAGPFYLWLHYVDPHAAYVPHPAHDFGKKSRDLYDGEVAFVDEHLGRLLDFIERSVLASRTAILLTSDHGEAFGEHGMMRHGFEVWEELVHVPLLVHIPGVAPHHVAERRSAIDVVPTLLELFQLPAPPGEGRDFVSGRSLLRDVVAPEGHHPDSRPVLVDMSEGPHNDERQAFFEGRFKLIATRGRPLGVYDLAADPGEKRDLLGEDPEAKAVVERFKAFRRALRSVPAMR